MNPIFSHGKPKPYFLFSNGLSEKSESDDSDLFSNSVLASEPDEEKAIPPKNTPLKPIGKPLKLSKEKMFYLRMRKKEKLKQKLLEMKLEEGIKKLEYNPFFLRLMRELLVINTTLGNMERSIGTIRGFILAERNLRDNEKTLDVGAFLNLD